MKRTIAILFILAFGISFCPAQNVQTQQQIERRYQNAIESAQKNFSQRLYSEAKRDYLSAREIKPENAAFIDEIIAGIDRLISVEANQGRPATQTAGPDQPPPTTNYQGTAVPGATLTAKLDWLVRSAESHNTYIVVVSADENIAPRTLQYSGAINITVVLRGDNLDRTIRLSSHGTMFTVMPNVTFILDGNITLRGHSQNTGSMVNVDGGIFKMNAGATITGNNKGGANTGGGGVYVGRNGTFEMTGGAISNNSAASGGGVYGSFTMSGGSITGNSATNGGGVMSGGFKMTGGTIAGNTAQTGGGVYGDNLYIYGGTISANIAGQYGGGVYATGDFSKTGGIITGYNSSQSDGNVVRDGSGVLARRGHTAYYNTGRITYTVNGAQSSMRRKETTAGPGVNLSSNSENNWDQ